MNPISTKAMIIMCSEKSKNQRLYPLALTWQLSRINKDSINLFVDLKRMVSVQVSLTAPTQHLDNNSLQAASSWTGSKM